MKLRNITTNNKMERKTISVKHTNKCINKIDFNLGLKPGYVY